jgi:hypothetical protein
VTLSSVARSVLLQVLAKEPNAVNRDGAPLPRLATPREFDPATIGWRADSQAGLVFIKFQHAGGVTKISF